MRHAILLLPLLLAADWDRFRGPNGTGVADDWDVPTTFDAAHVRWKAPLPGGGHSSPIVVKGRVYLAAATPKARMMVCLDADGKPAWKREVPGAVGKTHPLSSLASSTPCSDGERVFVSFWDGKKVALHAWDLDGNPLWDADLGPYKSQHGPGFSPVVVAGKVIVNDDQDGQADLYAFDAKTGKQAWKVPHKAFRACYSTPILHDGKLLVTTTAGVAAYDPDSGERAWAFDWKFPVKPLRTVGSSVIAGGVIVLPSGDGDGSRQMIGVTLPRGTRKAELAWQEDAATPYVPTPVAHGGHLYTVFDKGFAICRDATTGKETWRERLGGEASASPVLVGGKVYVFTQKGEATVFDANPKQFVLISRGHIGEEVMASPAVADGRLYVRGAKHLICFGKGK
ncbi:MAG: PQQ-binding-like beta-propeller repeat protein [Gemmataceae bacterium]